MLICDVIIDWLQSQVIDFAWDEMKEWEVRESDGESPGFLLPVSAWGEESKMGEDLH